MTDEEKKAIEDLIEEIVILKENSEMIIDSKELLKYKETLLNLIKKQQKEIEGLIKISKECIEEKFNNDKKWKDKIKAEIEESELLIDNSQGCMSNEDLYKEYGKIEFGQSLLEKE